MIILVIKIMILAENELLIIIWIIRMSTVGSQIVAQTQVETGDGPNKPSTINL